VSWPPAISLTSWHRGARNCPAQCLVDNVMVVGCSRAHGCCVPAVYWLMARSYIDNTWSMSSMTRMEASRTCTHQYHSETEVQSEVC
jgi:hypothetical protein